MSPIHDPLTRFIAQVGAIVLVSRLLGLLARRVGQPLVIAEITAGIALGPSLLGWVLPEVTSDLFAPSSLSVLGLVSQLGLVLFMFLVGLELDPALLRGRERASVAISSTSIIVPFGLGTLLAFHLHGTLSPPGVPFHSFALFLGISMSITAFPVLARILAERRLLKTRVGAIAIASAAVDDATAWCILAFVVAAARASGVGDALTTTFFMLSYIGVMVFAVRPLLRRVARRFAGDQGPTQNVIAGTILIILASAWTTELIGIHALFGAFLFGVVIPKDGSFAKMLAARLEDLVVVVLLPLFFAYSGLRTEIGLLADASAWWSAGLIILVACAGKFGGTFIAARVVGLGWRESGAIGVLMNTRGLIELIVLNIGLDLGVITPTLFTMMVIMALVTTFMTTPLLHLIYPPELLTTELLDRVEPSPTPPAVDDFTVLVCVAHPASGPGLVTVASALRGGAGRCYALGLVPVTERASFYVEGAPEPHEESALTPAIDRARDLGVAVKPLILPSADPGRDICDVARVKGANLVLLGWHRPLLTRSRLGGVVHEVLSEATSDVGVFIDRGLGGVRRVLVPFLGSPHDRAAIGLARRLAASSSAHVTILHIVKPSRAEGDTKLGARNEVDEVFHDEAGGEVVFRVVEHGSPPDAALAECKKGYDLVIVGFGREWGLAESPLGIQHERLLSDSPASVLVVHQGAATRGEARASEPPAGSRLVAPLA